jgi:hypothetical protein
MFIAPLARARKITKRCGKRERGNALLREEGRGKREFSPLFTFTFFLHLKLSKLSKPSEPFFVVAP